MKTAVVLYVKNEAHDILTWLIWHSQLGFDTFIICDDGSDDGTEDLIRIASRQLDIRFYPRDQTEEGFFYFRQEAFYKKVLQLFKDEFDWIAFFDADEYLSISKGYTLHEFLAMFGNADAIAVHWALYGSNGNILSPTIPSVAAFTRHCGRSEPICYHVKSIVRPSKVGHSWKNVHAFDVASYRDSDCNTFDWGHIPGITREAPTWNNAKLMHFQLRSMEQFVERCKRRPDITPDRASFDRLDVNSVEDVSPLTLMPEIMRRLRALIFEFSHTPIPVNEASSFSGDWTCCQLLTAHGDIVGSAKGRLTAANCSNVTVVAVFSALEGKCLLVIEGRELQFTAYHAQYSPASQEITLQHVDNLQFLTALPVEHGGELKATGAKIAAWEIFKIVPQQSPIDLRVADLMTALNSRNATYRIFSRNSFQKKELDFIFQVFLWTCNQNDVCNIAKVLKGIGIK